jgi:signal transduction histidine kinase
MTCRDGSVKTVAWSNISARFPIPGWATWGIGVDITERKRAEEALRQYAAELKARNEELDAFAHTVAHDLKGPSGHMVGFAQLLEDSHATLADEDQCAHTRGAGAAVRAVYAT